MWQVVTDNIHALVKEQRLDIINGDRQLSEKKSSEPKRK